jgi:hypothetical protein
MSSSELCIKLTFSKALPTSSDLSYSDLLRPFIKAKHICTIPIVTTNSKLQIEYSKEVASAALNVLGFYERP